MALPPPPVQAESGSFIWTDWYSSLTAYLSNGNSIPWSVINKSGSNLSELTFRSHQSLTSVQGGNGTEQYHLTLAQYNAVTATTTYVYSFNTRTGAVTLTSDDVTGALGYTPYNSTNPAGYISANQNITLSGDTTGSGTTAITTTLASVGTAGTYTKVTTDAKGRVTSGTTISASDINTALGAPKTVTGSRGGNAALASLLTQLASLGFITDSTTA